MMQHSKVLAFKDGAAWRTVVDGDGRLRESSTSAVAGNNNASATVIEAIIFCIASTCNVGLNSRRVKVDRSCTAQAPRRGQARVHYPVSIRFEITRCVC